jgi:hypothetical protein
VLLLAVAKGIQGGRGGGAKNKTSQIAWDLEIKKMNEAKEERTCRFFCYGELGEVVGWCLGAGRRRSSVRQQGGTDKEKDEIYVREYN